MRQLTAVTIALLVVVLSLAGIAYGQTTVIKPETAIASIDTWKCYPDISMLRNSENFVIVYPAVAGDAYAAIFREYDRDGEPLGINGLIENGISVTDLNQYGVGTASSNALFTCVYSQHVEGGNLSITYSEQFLHSGSQTGEKQILDDLPDSSPDGTFRVTMPVPNRHTHFASENRIEFYAVGDAVSYDLDATYCGKPLTPVTLDVGGFDQIDPVDVYGENDDYQTDATSLESYWQTSTYQWILYTWTRQVGSGGNNFVFARPARYNSVTQKHLWMAEDPVQLSNEHVGAYSEAWTDVDLTEDNDFLVVWNQVENNPGIWVCKLDYEGNILSGYPVRIVPLSAGTLTGYPSIVTFHTEGSVKYVITWAQYYPEEDAWNIVGVPVRSNDNPLWSYAFRVTNATRLAGITQHKMDATYSPFSDRVRFALTWAGEDPANPQNKSIYYAVYQTGIVTGE
jgi:hypothetical protein